MKKLRSITFLILFLIFLCFSYQRPLEISAESQAVSGLQVGNMFTYSNTYSWISTNPIDVVPSNLIAQNASTLQVTVQNVTGATVTLLEEWTYTNGSQTTNVEYAEVDNGSTGSILAFAANLIAGQPLFPGATNMPSIKYTISRSYGSTFRPTNYIEVNNTGVSSEAYSYINLYFDQPTGICVEYYLTTVYTEAPNQLFVQHLLLTNSTVWSISMVSSQPPPTSTPSSVTLSSSPTFSAYLSESASALNLGNVINFTVEVQGGKGPFTYEWYFDDQSVGFTTNSRYSTNSSEAGNHHVYAIVTDSNSNTVQTLTVEFDILTGPSQSSSPLTSPSSSVPELPSSGVLVILAGLALLGFMILSLKPKNQKD